MSNMKLSSFEVSNFKSIKDSGNLQVNDFNILIGKNDVGKSSFLEAINRFLDEDKPEDAHFHKDEEDEIDMIAEFTNVPDDIKDNLADKHNPSSDKLTIKRQFERREGRKPSDNTFVNEEKVEKGSITLDDDELTMAKSRSYIWQYLPEPIFIPSERDVTEQTKLKRGTLLNNILYPIIKTGSLNDIESIGEAKEKVEKALEKTSKSIEEKLTEKMQDYVPNLEKTEIKTSSLKLEKAFKTNLRLKDKYLPHSVEISERGSGVGDLLILSLMQTYVDYEVGKGYCLLFEEPGGSLHPGAEKKMFSALEQISEEGGQVLITSHSQVFIDKTKSANMFIVKRSNGESKYERKEDNLFDLINELGARKSDLLLSDFVIYTEGPSDARILNEIGKRAIDNWNKYNITTNFLGGTSNAQHCNLEKLKNIAGNFGFLLDSDRESQEDNLCKEIQDLKEKCSSNDIPCCVLNRREIENYFSKEAINEVLDLNLKENSFDNYTDMGEVLNEGNYSKTTDGPKIVDNMYKRDQSIDEIEEFLRKCIE